MCITVFRQEKEVNPKVLTNGLESPSSSRSPELVRIRGRSLVMEECAIAGK